MIILLVDIKLQLMVVKHCTPRGPNAQAACFRQVFFYSWLCMMSVMWHMMNMAVSGAQLCL